jgi:hypothetical protein
LEGRLASQEARLAAQQGVIERLLVKRADAAPTSSPILPTQGPSSSAAAGDIAPKYTIGRRASRRALLRLSGAAAAAGVAAGAIELWKPAGARAVGARIDNTITFEQAASGAGNVAIQGDGSSGAYGLKGTSDSGDAVTGISFGGRGVYGSSTGDGVHGFSSGASGVAGISFGGVGGYFSGSRAALNLQPALALGAPSSGPHFRGDVYLDSATAVWLCVADGTPGNWVKVAAPQYGYAGGALNLLPVPIRLLDTRAGASVGNTRPGAPVAYQGTINVPAAGVTYQSQTIPSGARAAVSRP